MIDDQALDPVLAEPAAPERPDPARRALAAFLVRHRGRTRHRVPARPPCLGRLVPGRLLEVAAEAGPRDPGGAMPTLRLGDERRDRHKDARIRAYRC